MDILFVLEFLSTLLLNSQSPQGYCIQQIAAVEALTKNPIAVGNKLISKVSTLSILRASELKISKAHYACYLT
jgi:hypothetical protein